MGRTHRLQNTANGNLTEFRSGLTPGQIIEIERRLAQERYAQLVLGNAVGYALAYGIEPDDILDDLPDLIAREVATSIDRYPEHVKQGVARTEKRLYFVEQ